MSHEEHDKAQTENKTIQKKTKKRKRQMGKYVIGMQYTDQFSKCHYSTTRKR